MFRLNQIIRNSFIRLGAFFAVFFTKLSSLWKNIFGFFAKLLGFSQSEYFLESNDAQGVKRDSPKQSTQAEPAKANVAIATTRRRPNPQMDYFLDMAREMKKK